MRHFFTHPEGVTTTVDFATTLSLPLTGLIGVVWFSAGLLASITIGHYISQRIISRVEGGSMMSSHSEDV